MNSSYDAAKFKAMVHYICSECEDYRKLGATKLNKVVLYAEREAYLHLGDGISSPRFVKRQFGPVPVAMVPVLNELSEEKKILVRERSVGGNVKRDFINLAEPDISMFSPEEISIIDRVAHDVCHNHTANSISLETHDDVWEMAAIGEDIPMYTVFAVQGEIDEDDIMWAQGEIEKLATAA
jgi:hypothetical protein